MSQVKIYGHREHLRWHRDAISDAVQGALVEAIGSPQVSRFHRFIGLEAADFIHPSDRTAAYTIIEIDLFSGWPEEARRHLIRELFARMEGGAGIAPHNVEIVIHESPAVNWGIWGRSGDELRQDGAVEN